MEFVEFQLMKIISVNYSYLGRLLFLLLIAISTPSSSAAEPQSILAVSAAEDVFVGYGTSPVISFSIPENAESAKLLPGCKEPQIEAGVVNPASNLEVAVAERKMRLEVVCVSCADGSARKATGMVEGEKVMGKHYEAGVPHAGSPAGMGFEMGTPATAKIVISKEQCPVKLLPRTDYE